MCQSENYRHIVVGILRRISPFKGLPLWVDLFFVQRSLKGVRQKPDSCFWLQGLKMLGGWKIDHELKWRKFSRWKHHILCGLFVPCTFWFPSSGIRHIPVVVKFIGHSGPMLLTVAKSVNCYRVSPMADNLYVAKLFGNE